jgi:hypothetical protein
MLHGGHGSKEGLRRKSRIFNILLSSVGAENSVPTTLAGLRFFIGSPLMAFHCRFVGE